MMEHNIHIYPDGRMIPKSIACYIGLSKGTLANWRTSGKGPKFTLIGGRIFYYQSEVDGWLQREGMFQTTAQARLSSKRLINS